MPAYITRRVLQFVPTLLGVMLLVFGLFSWIGGDPAYLLVGKIPNPEQIENIRRQLGVDQPYYVQFWIFVKQVATGLGPSLIVLLPMLAVSTLLAMAAAMLVAHVRGSLTDRTIMIGCTVGQSI